MPHGTVKDVRTHSFIAYFIKALHFVVNVIHLLLKVVSNSFKLNKKQTGELVEDDPLGKGEKKRKFKYYGPEKLCVGSRVSFENQLQSDEVEVIDKLSNDNC